MAGEYDTHMAIELIADGLHAQFDDILFSPWDRDDLVNFLDGLAADFHGWTRSTNMEHELPGTRGQLPLRWTRRTELDTSSRAGLPAHARHMFARTCVLFRS
jgi:hypothetical protein